MDLIQYYNNMSDITIISACIVVLGGFFIAATVFVAFSRGNIPVALLILTIVLIIGLALAYVSGYYHDKATEACVDAGYTVYLDGVKVDPDNIEIKLYRVSVDNDNKKLMLTHKK